MERSRRTFLTAISGTALISLAGTWATAEGWAQAADHAQRGKAVGDELVTLLEETSARLVSLATE